MSDELDKLRESIKRSKKVIESGKALSATESVLPSEPAQTETEERTPKEEPPRSE